MTATYSKYPSEEYSVGFDYTGKLPTGATIASCAVTATDEADGSSASSLLGSAVGTVSGDTVAVFVQGGTAGKRYRISFVTTLAPAGKIRDDILVAVK